MNGKVLIVDFVLTTPIYTSYFCNALKKEGIEYDLLSPINHPDIHELKHIDLHAVSSNEYRDTGIGKLYTYLSHWFYILRNAKKYDAIHFQWFPMLSKSGLDLIFLKLLKKSNNKLFFTAHNILPHNNTSQKIAQRFEKLYHLFPHIVVHSLKTKDDLVNKFSIPVSRITKIQHGPIFNEFAQIDTRSRKEELCLAMIGTIKPYKGIEDAIALIHKLSQKEIPAKLLVTGKGNPNYVRQLERLISETSVQDRISIQNKILSVSELIEAHRTVDAILTPYKAIDQSGVAITALSLGKPVIGYAIGGLRELVQQEYNGWLSESFTPENLVSAITWLKNNDHEEISKNCLDSLETISWSKSIQQLKPIYFS